MSWEVIEKSEMRVKNYFATGIEEIFIFTVCSIEQSSSTFMTSCSKALELDIH